MLVRLYGEPAMAKAWITYADIAVALGIIPEAVPLKAIERRWRSRRDKDGRALVLVDLEAEKARPVDRRAIEALEAHIAILKAAIAKAEALAEQRHREAEAALWEIQRRAGEPGLLLQPTAERSAGEARVRAEFEAYRAPPW
jgi:hypothetical protein